MSGSSDWVAEAKCDSPETAVEHDLRFVGKVIVITGAGGQFGREGCVYFAKRGARIAALDNNQEGLQGTFEALNQSLDDGSFDFKAFICDITSAGDTRTVTDAIVERFCRIDLLWNNAGYQGKIATLLEYDPEDFRMVMDINVTGAFIVLQAVAKVMSKRDPDATCCVVNTASVAGMRGTPAMTAYASSKAAIFSLTSVAAKDLAPFKIRVNAVSPALIGPGFMWDRQNELHAECNSPYFANDPKTVAQNKINSVPMKRLGSVEEVLKVVAFLMSDESSYMTGSNLVVDGGMASGVRA
jgi:NAD(P)-dependent dehydrogenase (short-subunit alcohol dehydrogenase family)